MPSKNMNVSAPNFGKIKIPTWGLIFACVNNQILILINSVEIMPRQKKVQNPKKS